MVRLKLGALMGQHSAMTSKKWGCKNIWRYINLYNAMFIYLYVYTHICIYIYKTNQDEDWWLETMLRTSLANGRTLRVIHTQNRDPKELDVPLSQLSHQWRWQCRVAAWIPENHSSLYVSAYKAVYIFMACRLGTWHTSWAAAAACLTVKMERR